MKLTEHEKNYFWSWICVCLGALLDELCRYAMGAYK